MNDRSERTWHPTVNHHCVRITQTRQGLFVSPLFPSARHNDTRQLSRSERVMWRFLRRPPKVI